MCFQNIGNNNILAGTKEIYLTEITQMKYVLLKMFTSKIHKGDKIIIFNPKMQKNMRH